MSNLIEINDIHHQVDKNLSIDIDQLFFQDGPVYAIIGENGSGKSTLLRILALLEPPDSGTVALFGEEANDRKNLVKLRRRIGYLPQSPTMFRNTVYDNIALGLGFRGKETDEIEARIANLLTDFQSPDLVDIPVQNLSGGQRQIVALMRVLAYYPEILLLDEPFQGLDKQYFTLLINYIKVLNSERGVTVILTTKSRDIIQRLVNISISMRYGKIIRIRTGEHQVQSESETSLRPS